MNDKLQRRGGAYEPDTVGGPVLPEHAVVIFFLALKLQRFRDMKGQQPEQIENSVV